MDNALFFTALLLYSPIFSQQFIVEIEQIYIANIKKVGTSMFIIVIDNYCKTIIDFF